MEILNKPVRLEKDEYLYTLASLDMNKFWVKEQTHRIDIICKANKKLMLRRIFVNGDRRLGYTNKEETYYQYQLADEAHLHTEKPVRKLVIDDPRQMELVVNVGQRIAGQNLTEEEILEVIEEERLRAEQRRAPSPVSQSEGGQQQEETNAVAAPASQTPTKNMAGDSAFQTLISKFKRQKE